MSKIEVNQISSQCGSTLTIGQSGDSIQLACGATQTGFGRTGTVDWDTTAKTASFTAVSGNGYFVNTTSGAITVTMPATPSAGDIVAVKDYAGTFATNNLTLGRNGSNFEGLATDAILSTNSISATFVYVDGTKGWSQVNDSTTRNIPQFVAATGGTILTNGNYKTHVFTGPGTFCVSNAGNPAGSITVDYIVVAGGGGSSNSPDSGAAGGGAGGFRLSNSVGCIPAPTMSPLTNSNGLPVTVQGYPVTIGAGGANQPPGEPPSNPRNPGSNSIFSSITSAGGGASGRTGPGLSGGSGGGGSQGPTPTSGYPGGAGNTPPVSPPQGNSGGAGFDGISCSNTGGGGGGAAAAGTNAALFAGGPGGIGSYIDDTFIGPTAPSYGTPGPVGSTRYFAGGGGGNTDAPGTGGSGGAGGGGKAFHPSVPSCNTNGTVNTGGGSGAGGPSGGGSGIVIIRYKYQ
jgi:hypothetical protein